MGLFSKRKEEKTKKAQGFIDDMLRRCEINARVSQEGEEVTKHIDKMNELKNAGWLKDYFENTEAKYMYGSELLEYPYTLEESEVLGSQYIEMYKAKDNLEKLSALVLHANIAFFACSDKYGYGNINEPKEADLSRCYGHLLFEKVIHTINYEDFNTPVSMALKWGLKEIFASDGRFHKDMPLIKYYLDKILPDEWAQPDSAMSNYYYLNDFTNQWFKNEQKKLGFKEDLLGNDFDLKFGNEKEIDQADSQLVK